MPVRLQIYFVKALTPFASVELGQDRCIFEIRRHVIYHTNDHFLHSLQPIISMKALNKKKVVKALVLLCFLYQLEKSIYHLTKLFRLLVMTRSTLLKMQKPFEMLISNNTLEEMQVRW
jgi:hypothetical protein